MKMIVVPAFAVLCLTSSAVLADDNELILGRWEAEVNKMKYGHADYWV